jgi:hypothetical protein
LLDRTRQHKAAGADDALGERESGLECSELGGIVLLPQLVVVVVQIERASGLFIVRIVVVNVLFAGLG